MRSNKKTPVDLEAQEAPGALVRAGFWRRILSLCYEALLLAAILFISTWVFLFVIRGLNPALTRFLLQLYLIGVGAAYFTYCWAHGGQTLPMKTWHLRLVTREGKPVPPRTTLLRYVFALAGYSLAGVGVLWALFDRDHQFLHDRLAGTRIINHKG